jgi:hypothetical protein
VNAFSHFNFVYNVVNPLRQLVAYSNSSIASETYLVSTS